MRAGPVAGAVVLAVAGAAYGSQVGEYVEPAFGPAYDVALRTASPPACGRGRPTSGSGYPSRSEVAYRRRCRSAES